VLFLDRVEIMFDWFSSPRRRRFEKIIGFYRNLKSLDVSNNHITSLPNGAARALRV
jgi:Leucine-rich repeat (LRR) protein